MKLSRMLRVKMGWARPTGPRHDVVLSSRIRLARNLKDSPFPSHADARQFATIRTDAFQAAKQALDGAAIIAIDDVEAIDRDFLVERHLISTHLAQIPEHRGVVVGDGELLSLMVNEEDHLRIQGIDSGLALDSIYQRANALDDQLAKSLPFAFDPTWGYLTACPTNTGTGMRASCLVHLPALSLTGELDAVLQGLSRLGVIVRGLYGEGTKVMGDFFQISNATALGASESQIISSVTQVVEGLVKKEEAARRSLSSAHGRTRLEDLIYRSIGVLSNARMVTYEETMKHLSYARMGLAIGWEIPTTLTTVNELTVLSQPAHIQQLAGKPLDGSDRDFLRATLLRRKFSQESA